MSNTDHDTSVPETPESTLPVESSTDDVIASGNEEINDEALESTEEVSEEHSEDDQNEPPLSRGLDKRVQGLLKSNATLKEANEALEAKLWRQNRDIQSLQTNFNQFVQQKQQPIPQSTVNNDPRLDINSPNFDFNLFVQSRVEETAKNVIIQQRQQEKMQEAAQTAFKELQTVDSNLSKGRALDPTFDKQMEMYEGLFTEDMRYALSTVQNPSAFIKKMFKNEKDIRALQHLSTKHPAEQIRTITRLATEFELNVANKVAQPAQNQTQSKPKPIPNIGRGSMTLEKHYDPKTNRFSREFIEKDNMRR